MTDTFDLSLTPAEAFSLSGALRVFEDCLDSEGLAVLMPGNLLTLRWQLDEFKMDHPMEAAQAELAERNRVNDILRECDL